MTVARGRHDPVAEGNGPGATWRSRRTSIAASVAIALCVGGCDTGPVYPEPSVEWGVAEESPIPDYSGATLLDRPVESVDHLNVPDDALVFVGALNTLDSNEPVGDEYVASAAKFTVLEPIRGELPGTTMDVAILGGTAEGRTSDGTARFDKGLLAAGGAFLVVASPGSIDDQAPMAWQVFAITPQGLSPVHRRNEYPLPAAPPPLAFDEANQGLLDAGVISAPLEFGTWLP